MKNGSMQTKVAKLRKYDIAQRKEYQAISAIAEAREEKARELEATLSKGQLRRLRRKNAVSAGQRYVIAHSERKALWDSLGW